MHLYEDYFITSENSRWRTTMHLYEDYFITSENCRWRTTMHFNFYEKKESGIGYATENI